MTHPKSLASGFLAIIVSAFSFLSCSVESKKGIGENAVAPLHYVGSPSHVTDRSMLMFSDRGAWFAYSLPDSTETHLGFAGPFLMTQENGVWASANLTQLLLERVELFGERRPIDLNSFSVTQAGTASHLFQNWTSEDLNIKLNLFFLSEATAAIKVGVENLTSNEIKLVAKWSGALMNSNLTPSELDTVIRVESEKSDAVGDLTLMEFPIASVDHTSYKTIESLRVIPGNETVNFYATQSFYFPGHDLNRELALINSVTESYDELLNQRIQEKTEQIEALVSKIPANSEFAGNEMLAAKLMLTLQNNWRQPAGGLYHQGLFPSYHYKWFNGFWSWDSWKHAVALVHFNKELAKDQIRAMYDFQNDLGFIADVVYRDTTIEANNYRDTKPPLSGWAISEVFKHSQDTAFLQELYPKLKKYHQWWYNYRDHDQDGLCEYGSTDGSLIAAKWESGMDNAVRFDSSQILFNTDSAWSLNQESVDLNSYLYREKVHLSVLATILGHEGDSQLYRKEAASLAEKIQSQFWNESTGWFHDTDIGGANHIEAMGAEGWIPLWCKVATSKQAARVVQTMMDSTKFYTHLPFPTVSADNSGFKPDGGYWRGPVWLDQAYFAVKGLQLYGYDEEATEAAGKLFHNAEGVLQPGMPIRENYNPTNGAGLEAKNFSWSAAHYLLLLIDE